MANINKKKICGILLLLLAFSFVCCKVYFNRAYDKAFGRKLDYREICIRTMMYNDYSYKKYGDDRYKLSGQEAYQFMQKVMDKKDTDKLPEAPDNVQKYMKWYFSIYPCGALTSVVKHDEYYRYCYRWEMVNHAFGVSKEPDWWVIDEYVPLDEKNKIKIYEMLQAYYNSYSRKNKSTEGFITFDEIIDFYSSERDSQGVLRIKNAPDSLLDVALWHFNGMKGRHLNDPIGDDYESSFDFHISNAIAHYRQNIGDIPDEDDLNLDQMKIICKYLEDNWDEILGNEVRFWSGDY